MLSRPLGLCPVLATLRSGTRLIISRKSTISSHCVWNTQRPRVSLIQTRSFLTKGAPPLNGTKDSCAFPSTIAPFYLIYFCIIFAAGREINLETELEAIAHLAREGKLKQVADQLRALIRESPPNTNLLGEPRTCSNPSVLFHEINETHKHKLQTP